MNAIDQGSSQAAKTAAQQRCRSQVARQSLAEGLGKVEDDITDEELEEALEDVAVSVTRKAMKACGQVDASQKVACKTDARAKTQKPECESSQDASQGI